MVCIFDFCIIMNPRLYIFFLADKYDLNTEHRFWELLETLQNKKIIE